MSKKFRGDEQQPRPREKNVSRCKVCFVPGEVGYGEERPGSILIREPLMLRIDGDTPNEMIGQVIRCSNMQCTSLPFVKLWKKAQDLDIEPAKVVRLVRTWQGSPSFRLDEFYSGEKAPIELSPAIQEIIRQRPVFNAPKPDVMAASLFDEVSPL